MANSPDPEREKENQDESDWNIPPPPKELSNRGKDSLSSSTPLLPRLRRPLSKQSNVKGRSNFDSARLLFWGDDPNSSGMSHFENESSNNPDDFPRPNGLAAYFFGFVYENSFNNTIEFD